MNWGCRQRAYRRARLSEYRPLERLVYAIMMDFLPRVEPYESTLTVDFFPSGEWVHMVVTLSPTHDVEFTRMASEVLARQSRNLDIPELNPVGQEVQATAYQGMRANKGVGRHVQGETDGIERLMKRGL